MSHFQRYSQKENVVTNNTLLLLSRVYQFSPLRFERLINKLIEDDNHELTIGPSFTQQTVGTSSVPDGCISQSSFKLLVETKLNGNLNTDQLKRHLDCFSNEHQKILLTIDSTEISYEINKVVQHIAKEKNIVFISTTFKSLIEACKSLLADYEIEIVETLKDYENFCLEMNLLQLDKQRMVAVACGLTLELNLKYSLYYHPVDRNFQPITYIGLYSKKAIRAIGKITYTVDAKLRGDQLITFDIFGKRIDLPKDKHYDILNSIKLGIELYNHQLLSGYRFFLVDNFYEIDFNKVSPHGIVSKKYFNLSDFSKGQLPESTAEIASMLDASSFK